MLLATDWTTLIAAFGGSILGAAAGIVGAVFAFRGAALTVRSQEREA